jgi:hypothetical protein
MKHLYPIILATLFICSCTQDAYEKGEGKYSLMRADLVEAHANSDSLIDYIITDDNERLELTQPRSHKWGKKTDTLYRAAFYYSKNADAKAEVLSASRVSTVNILHKDSLKDGMKTDPTTLESIWLSKNKRYLNLSLYLKTGQGGDEKALQQLAVIGDTLLLNADNTHTFYLNVYHDQGGVPEYYSERIYFSIPLYNIQTDSVCITIPTYKGTVVKRLKTK